MGNKLWGAAAAALLSTAWATPSDALQVTATFDWTGDNGYTVSGVMTYDDSLPVVSSNGLGETDGIEALSVSFFDPSSTLLATFDDVVSGTSSYNFLTVSYDTAEMAFSGSLDIGADTDTAGEYYLSGTIPSLTLHNVGTEGTDDHSDTAPINVEVAPVPVPAVGFIGLALALAGTGMTFRRRRAA